MWALTQAGPWTSTLNDTPLRVSSIIWYRLGFCFQTLFDFGIFWQPIIYFLRWKKQIKKWMIYQTKYLYPPALAHNIISVFITFTRFEDLGEKIYLKHFWITKVREILSRKDMKLIQVLAMQMPCIWEGTLSYHSIWSPRINSRWHIILPLLMISASC
jgi:hypothetical protein